MNDSMLIINSVCSCVLAVTVIIAICKGWINEKTLTGITTILESLSGNGNGLIDDLAKYAALAVRTVEQLCKTGALKKDNTIRQETAVEMVRELAEVDYDAEVVAKLEYSTIATIVDAEVNKLPRNN